VAEASGGTARHTRAWSASAPAIVADCRRLRLRRLTRRLCPLDPSLQEFVIDSAKPLAPLPRSLGVPTHATRQGTLSPLSGEGPALPQLLDREAGQIGELVVVMLPTTHSPR